MTNFFKSLRVRLFIWYAGSLIIVITYFLLFVHFYTIPYGLQILVALFTMLAMAGFIIIYKITSSLTYLSSRMKLISDKNLSERVHGIRGADEIGELALAFNNLLNRLDAAFKREQQFIADVAHELKTPLATLRSSFEVALNKLRTNEEYRRVIQEAIVEADDLSTTLKNVLDLAWSEAPDAKKKPMEFNLTNLVEDLTEIAQKMAIKKHIHVIASLDKNIHINGFRDRLGRALLNVIDNAIKYTPEKGEISIELQKDHQAIITIKDSGKGIAEKDLPHIFDRFYRGSASDKVFGAGLGLAITKSIVTLHSGTITVRSKLGKGSTFIIALPLL
jgi:signal transduction histidine kinase